MAHSQTTKEHGHNKKDTIDNANQSQKMSGVTSYDDSSEFYSIAPDNRLSAYNDTSVPGTVFNSFINQSDHTNDFKRVSRFKPSTVDNSAPVSQQLTQQEINIDNAD